ncbi:hypothetical protein SNE40_006920 [Patella caerulea]|uniref:Neurotransmitter-gated ion-channel ligand-binding domain-containing protein n=1 Tax=Patella caerulea TaxID=87958 RepID=A0AAN8Q1L2_PATCE
MVKTCLKRFFFVFSLFGIAESQALYEDTRRLYEDLFSNHSSAIRPIVIQSDRLDLNVTVELNDVFLDGVALNLRLKLTIDWVDETLRWLIGEYASIDTVYPKSSDLWIPSFVVPDSLDKEGFICHESMMRLQNTGKVDFICRGNMRVKCKTNFVQYPLDQHVCEVVVLLKNFRSSEVQFVESKLVEESMHGDTRNWQTTGQVGVGIRQFSWSSVSALVMTLRLNRDFVYVVVYALAPVILLSMLNLMTFWIPDKSVKVYYSVTQLLIMVITVAPESTHHPRTSNCAYNLYISLLLFLNIVVVNVTVTLWRQEHKAERGENSDDENEDKRDSIYDFRNPQNYAFTEKKSIDVPKGCFPWCSSKKVEDFHEAQKRKEEERIKQSRNRDYKLFIIFAVLWSFITCLFLVKLLGIV